MPPAVSAAHSAGFGFAPVADLPEISASDLKNKFSEVARLASREPLAVTRHHRREYVILTTERYEELQQSHRAPLENLSAEFDQLIAKMNTPKGKRATAALFAASAKDLGRAAMSARRKADHA